MTALNFTVNLLKFLTLSNKFLVFSAGIHKMLIRIANREDSEQTLLLIWVCAVCLDLFGR